MTVATETQIAAGVDSGCLEILVKKAVTSPDYKEALEAADEATVREAIEQLTASGKPHTAKQKLLDGKLTKLVSGGATEEVQPSPAEQAEKAGDAKPKKKRSSNKAKAPAEATADEAKPELPKQVAPEVPEGEGFAFTCLQTDIVQYLPPMAKIVGRPSHPVLANLLIEVGENDVCITAFDLTTALRVRVDAQIVRTGRFTAPAQLFKDLISQLPSEPISILHNASEETITITSTTGKHTMKGLDAEQFPALPEFQGQKIAVPMSVLQDAIAHTKFSASDDETKQVLCGLRLELADKTLEMASTDGHRLSRYVAPAALPESVGVGATIPVGVADDLRRLAPGDESVTMQFDDGIQTEGELLLSNYVKFEATNGNLLICRLIDGQYPNYRQLIPSTATKFKVVVQKLAFVAALNRVSLFAERGIIKLLLEDGKMGISAHMADGAGDESIPAEWRSEKFVIAFNSDYLRQAIKVIPGEEVSIYMNATTASVLLVEERYTHLIMPVHIRGES